MCVGNNGGNDVLQAFLFGRTACVSDAVIQVYALESEVRAQPSESATGNGEGSIGQGKSNTVCARVLV